MPAQNSPRSSARSGLGQARNGSQRRKSAEESMVRLSQRYHVGMHEDTRAAIESRLIHHAYQPPAGFVAPQPPIHKASTVLFPNVAAMRARRWEDKSGYTYGLHGTPTTFVLEERLATLEGARYCTLVPSGLAAISTVALALLEQGAEVLLPDNVYGPSKALSHGLLERFGVRHVLYDALDPEDMERRITAQTRLVWIEAPGSVTMEFPDLVRLVTLSRTHGLWCALDNTWGAGLAFNPFDLCRDARLGVDVSVHALTKYPSGGGDVLMGSITTCDALVHQRIQRAHMHLGLGVGANDAEAVLRALPSLALRYHAQDAAARRLAQWLQQQPAVAQVLHPALPGAPGHAHWQTLCGAAKGEAGVAAGLFSVMIDARYSSAQVDAFCDALQLFRLGYSWGGPVSLVMPYDLDAMRAHPRRHVAPGTLVRFAVGLESVADLQQDLAQALRQAFGTATP